MHAVSGFPVQNYFARLAGEHHVKPFLKFRVMETVGDDGNGCFRALAMGNQTRALTLGTHIPHVRNRLKRANYFL